MEKGLEILVSELQKQNQILQTAKQEAEQKTRFFEEKTKLAEESAQKTKEEFKHLQFLYDRKHSVNRVF